MNSKTLDKICKSIQKKYGAESVNFLGNTVATPMPRFSTQCASLDAALGGGIPRGRIVEIYGPEQSGKSTVCYHMLAQHQKEWPDDPAALIDVEFSFDPIYAQIIGADVSNLLVSQPDDGTDALNILVDLIENEGVKFVIVDSVAALMPKEESEAGLEEQQMGLQARLMSKALRKLVGIVSRNNATILFTNQTRDKIGVMGYGEKTTTPGGKALRFYASIRIKQASLGTNKEGEEKVSLKIQSTVTKNKTAPPFRVANYTVRFGIGIDQLEDLMDNAFASGVLVKKGAWISYNGENVAQGRGNLREMISTNKTFHEELLQKVKDTGTLTKAIKPSADDEAEAADGEIDPDKANDGKVDSQEV